jgi:hypothetical protein
MTTKSITIERVYRIANYESVRLAMDVTVPEIDILTQREAVEEAYLHAIANLDRAYARILEREKEKFNQ